MQSSNTGYCYICNEFYMKQQLADLESKLAESEEELKQYKYAYENSMVLDYTSRNWLAVGSIQQENEQLKQQLAESEKDKERIKKNWRISRTQQQKLYENLKQENKKAGVVNYPIFLDGCRISNEEQLLDFAKDFVLEKAYWQKQLAEKDRKIKGLGLYTKNVIDFAVEQLEKVKTQFRTKYSWYEETHKVCEKTDNFVIWLDNQIKQLRGE